MSKPANVEIVGKEDYLTLRNFEKNLFNFQKQKLEFKDKLKCQKAINTIVKREMTKILYSLFEKNVYLPKGEDLEFVNINYMNFNMNIKPEDLYNESTFWFLAVIKMAFENSKKLDYNTFLKIISYGTENEPTMYKVLYDRIVSLMPTRFIFVEKEFYLVTKNQKDNIGRNNNYQINPYKMLTDYWNKIKSPETLYLSTFIIKMIAEYHKSYDANIKLGEDATEKERNGSQKNYDRTKYSFFIKKGLSENASSLDERTTKFEMVKDALGIAKEMETLFYNIQERLKEKEPVLESEKMFHRAFNENNYIISEVSQLSDLIRL